MKKTIKVSKIILKNLYENKKLSISKIAKIYNCSYWFIWKKMKEYGIKARSLSDANKLNMLSHKINISKNTLQKLYVKRKIPVTKIAKMYKCHHKTILRKMKEFNIKSRSMPEAMTIYPKKNFSGELLEKAYLIGFRQGDLYVHRINPKGDTIRVECSTTHPKQIELFRRLFCKYGHIHEFQFNGFRRETRITCYLNNSFTFLLNKNDMIEKWILENDKYFFAFLAGYIDAEGHIGIHPYGNNKQACFLLASYDKNILYQLWIKLISLDIKCPKPIISSKKGYVSKAKPLPYKKDYWVLGIYSKMSLLKIFDGISPHIKHAEKIMDIEKAINNINLRNIEFGNLRMRLGAV